MLLGLVLGRFLEGLEQGLVASRRFIGKAVGAETDPLRRRTPAMAHALRYVCGRN